MGAKGYELSAQSGELRASLVEYGNLLLAWHAAGRGEGPHVAKVVRIIERSAMPEGASPRKARRAARKVERSLARAERVLARRVRREAKVRRRAGRGKPQGPVAAM